MVVDKSTPELAERKAEVVKQMHENDYKARCKFDSASPEAKIWWSLEETKLNNKDRTSAGKILEKLYQYKGTLNDFYAAHLAAKTDDLPAVFMYMEYMMRVRSLNEK